MNKRIFWFNILYYAITLLLIKRGVDDPSSSLGYGYLVIAFWILGVIVLSFLLIRKQIRIKTSFDVIGVFTATPVLPIICIYFFSFAIKPIPSSERYFDKNGYHYKILTYDKDKSTNGKRIEIYRNSNMSSSENTSSKWIRDSTWIYLFENGDTAKKEKYVDGVETK